MAAAAVAAAGAAASEMVPIPTPATTTAIPASPPKEKGSRTAIAPGGTSEKKETEGAANG